MDKVAIIGAGPVGLDAALALARAGIEFHLLEAGEGPATHVRRWGDMRLEVPWRHLVSARMRRDLRSPGREFPDDDERPTAAAFAELLEQVAEIPLIRSHLLYRHRVLAVGREGLGPREEVGTDARAARPFRLLVETPDGEGVLHARAVLDCSGAFARPLPMGPWGVPAPGESTVEEVIVRHPPEVDPASEGWAGKGILLVGESAAARGVARRLAALVQADPEARVYWSVRDADPAWLTDDPELADLRRGAVDRFAVLTGTVVAAVEREGDQIQLALKHDDGLASIGEVHRIVSLTGWEGDRELTAALHVRECPVTGVPQGMADALARGEQALAAGEAETVDAFVDPDALVNDEPALFLLGARSFGRRDDFRVDMGYRQVDQLALLLPGREIPDWGRSV